MDTRFSRRGIFRAGGVVAGAGLLAPQFPGRAGAQSVAQAEPKALPRFPAVRHLDVVNLDRASAEEIMLFNTLQGLVARTEPRLYGLWPSSNDDVWLSRLDVPHTGVDFWDAVLRYKHAARGTVVYDPGLPDTINVATTLAGLHDAVVVDPELASRLAAAPYGLRPLIDLRRRFGSKLEAYRWQFQKLWPQCTHTLLSGYVPDLIQPVARGNDWVALLVETDQVHDSSNRKVRTVDLSGLLGKGPVYVRFEDSFPADGWGPQLFHLSVTADGHTIADFTPTTDAETPFLFDQGTASALIAPEMNAEAVRFADGGSYFVYRFTPPDGTTHLSLTVDVANEFGIYATNVTPTSSQSSHPFTYLRDYQVAVKAMAFSLDPNQESERALFSDIAAAVEPNTPYLGWFTGGVAGEWGGVGLLSQHSCYVLAADYNTNTTVHAGIRTRPRRSPVAKAPAVENKIYLTFCYSDGDNVQFNEHRLQQIWDDPGRGKAPINWTIQPHLAELMPAILDYYQRTATPNDCFMTGASGAGYVVPAQWPDDTFPLFAQMTHRLMDSIGITTVSAINYRSWSSGSLPLSGAKAEDYARIVQPLGIVLPSNAPQLIWLDGDTPESGLSGAGDPTSMETIIGYLSANWDGKAPVFYAVQPSGWSMTPTDIASVVDSLDDRYRVVRGDQFFELIRAVRPTE